MSLIKLHGDHSAYHCGAAAVWQVLDTWASRAGTVTSLDDYEVLIVNGEGSMHHGRPTFHRKMRELETALSAEKPAYLVNTVWQNNPHEYDYILTRLNGVFCRDALSKDELHRLHNRCAAQTIDLSFFAPVNPAQSGTDFKGGAVRTDFYSRSTGDFEDLSDPRLAMLPLHSMRNTTWSRYVTELTTASLLVTGRHHAVCAACKARTPFAAIEGNSHKISGLLHTARVNIPVAKNVSELPELVAWAENNHTEYERLFDWVEEIAARGVEGFALPLL